jgi:hypothetical protein
MADNQNPHGTKLFQTNLVCSGLAVLENLTVIGDVDVKGSMTVEDDSILSGTSSFSGDLTVNGTLTVQDLSTIGSLSVASGFDIYGTSRLRKAMTLRSGVSIDGRDPSADGTAWDTHVVAINPHNITLNLLSGLNVLTGGTVTANVGAASGISFDGVDVSELAVLLNGNNADALHSHVMSGFGLTSRYIGFSPLYASTVESGVGAGTLSTDVANNMNVYSWDGDLADQIKSLVTRFLVPEDFDSWGEIRLWNMIDSTTNANFVSLSLFDTDNAAVETTGGSWLQNTSWTENEILISAGAWVEGSFATLVVDMKAASGDTAKVGDLRLRYTPK